MFSDRLAGFPLRQAAFLLCLLTALFGLSTATTASPQQSNRTQGAGSTALTVKFVDEGSIELRDNRLVSEEVDLRPVDAMLRGAPALSIEPVFSQPADELAADLDAIERRSGRDVPDLTSYFRFVVPTGQAAAIAEALRRLDVVERLEVDPAPADLPSTPDYSPYQGYRSQAPTGIGALAAAVVPGGRGERVRIVDVETEWNTAHEDLSKARNALVPGTTACSAPGDGGFDHGTAVAGILSADNNSFGVTGIVPSASLGLAGVWRFDSEGRCTIWRGPDAINDARRTMSPGDVLLIEQQAYGPQSGIYLPLEWYGVIYDVITAAVADGIIVVEVGGNSGVNLDDPQYGASFPMGKPHSGAIIVGAGVPSCSGQSGLSRLDFSNFGSRVDLQAWGNCIVTTGYGYLDSRAPRDAQYTDNFGGTSGASAIVAGAAASLSSAIEARTGRPATPAEVRKVLVATGTPQRFVNWDRNGHIGPMPDLADALAWRGEPPPLARAGADFSVSSGAPFTLDAGQSSDPQGQPLTFAWAQSLGPAGRVRDPNRARTEVEAVEGPATLIYEVRVADSHGLLATDQVSVSVRAPK